jgi:hypothetical protein
VLPGEDADAAEVLEDVLTRRGMNVLSQVADGVGERDGDTVTVTLTDGRTGRGLALHPRARLGAQHRRTSASRRPGVELDDGGFIKVDRVSRTSARGRLRRRRLHRRLHARLGRRHAGPDRDVALPRRRGHPLDLKKVSSNVFTAPRSPPSAGRRRPSTPARCSFAEV